MHKIFQRRSLLLAAVIPALLAAGCAAGGGTEAMGGAASPGAPTTDMSSMPMESGSPTETRMESKDTPKGTVQRYFAALKVGSVDAVVALFGPDGLAAVQGSDTAEGTDAIRKLYQQTLTGPQSGTYTIEEAEKFGDEYAFVRATSEQDSQSTREFFILEKSGDGYKIDRLMSNQAS
ncbi:nuclear transport factor 2 family protein [Nonomuraea sp. NPDC050691]|uniref:YybH family protein n=1 Tax=Nonomuraea sp. NPDC050691 TaxID=3155661 RepID=UPI0033FCB5B2